MFWPKQSTFAEKIYFLVLAAFMAFPVIDFVLRNVLPVPVISSVWDDLLFAAGLGLVGLRFVFGRPQRRSDIPKAIIVFMLAGLAYTTLDLTTWDINFEGFRAVFQFMLVFFIAFYLNDRPENTRMLLVWGVVIGTLMALYGIYQYAANVPMPGHWVDTTEKAVRTRAWSITTSPNALGSQMAMMTAIALGLAMQEKSWTRKIFFLGASAAMGACLLVTFSRGAWLALAGAIAILGILYDRRILIAGIVAAVLAAVFVPAVSHRITYLFSAEYMAKSSQSGRISRWFEAYDQMRNSPLFGTGLGHFGGAVAKRHYNTIYVDNYYMKTLAEMGLVGLSMLVWLIFRTIREGYTVMQKLAGSDLRFMAAGMLAGLLAIVIHNGVENIFEIPYLNTYFWLVAGLLAALPCNAAKTGGDSNG